MNTRESLLAALGILCATLCALCLLGGWIRNIEHSGAHKAQVKIECFKSGQSWIYDKGLNGECVPQNTVHNLG